MNRRIDVNLAGGWLFGGNGPIIIQTLHLNVQGIHFRWGKDLVPGLAQSIHSFAYLLEYLGLRVLHRLEGVQEYFDYALPK